MEILETKGRKMNKIKREEREDLHTFSDTTNILNVRSITPLFVTQHKRNKTELQYFIYFMASLYTCFCFILLPLQSIYKETEI